MLEAPASIRQTHGEIRSYGLDPLGRKGWSWWAALHPTLTRRDDLRSASHILEVRSFLEFGKSLDSDCFEPNLNAVSIHPEVLQELSYVHWVVSAFSGFSTRLEVFCEALSPRVDRPVDGGESLGVLGFDGLSIGALK
jgi:hypothetical protein